MTKGHIRITGGKSKPKGSKQAPKTKPRKPRPKTDEYIEIVDSSASLQDEEGRPHVQSDAADVSPENHKDSSETTFGHEGVNGENNKDCSSRHQVGARAVPQPTTPDPTVGAAIAYGDTLKRCMTVDEVRGWFVRQQADFNEKVDRAFSWRRLLDDTRAKAESILHQPGAVSGFHLGNDRLCLAAFEILRASIGAHVSANAAHELALITFIPGEYGTSMDRPVIDVSQSRKAVNDVMRKMEGQWFGAIDLAFFWTIPHADGGLHLQGHQHVLGWAPGFVEKAEEIALSHERRFKPNVTDLPVIKVVEAWDCSEVNVARLCAYLLKAPAKGKNWFEYPNGRHIMNHSEAKDRFIQFLRLAQIRSILGVGDIFLAGGDGVDIRSGLIKELRSLARADARGKAAIHPGLVPTFWEDFNQELGQSHWSLPAILRS